MNSELLKKIVLLKQSVDGLRTMPALQMMQKANRAQAILENAVYVIEELAAEHTTLAKKHAALEIILDDSVTNNFGLGERVDGE